MALNLKRNPGLVLLCIYLILHGVLSPLNLTQYWVSILMSALTFFAGLLILLYDKGTGAGS